MTGRIFNIQKFCIHDGPGIRTTVFLKGCPLRCVWCHNPEGLAPMAETAFFAHKCVGCGMCRRDGFTTADCLGDARVAYGEETTVKKLLPRLLADKPFYDDSKGGVTVSGGECLAQADFCAALLAALQREGVHTAVDTCGFVSWDAFARVLPHADMFLYDVKAYDEDVHIRCTGVSNKRILENLARLDETGKEIEIRIPFVPDYNDGEVEKIARFLSPMKHISRVRVLAYHNYAGSKYEALGLENTLPPRLPTDTELTHAKETIRRITGFDTP